MVEKLDLREIDPPREADRASIDPDEVKELAENIKTVGLLNPLVVVKRGERYEVVAGHRRFLAVGLLGWHRVECNVMEGDGDAVLRARFSENVQRAELSPFEEGYALAKMRERFGMSVAQLGEAVGKSVGWVQLRLTCQAWPEDLARAVHERKLSLNAAMHLSYIEDDAERSRLVRYGVESGLTVDTAKAWVHQWRLTKCAVDTSLPVVAAPAGSSQPIIVRYPCAICNGETRPEEIRILRVCVGCENVVSENRNHAQSPNGSRDVVSA